MRERLAANLSDKQDALEWAKESLERYAAAQTAPNGQSVDASGAELTKALEQLARSGLLASAPEVDGQYSRRLAAWKDFQGFAVGLRRWLLGGEPPAGVQATIERRGGQGIIRVELDPGRTRGGAGEAGAGTASVVVPGTPAGSAAERLTLRWVGDDALEAEFPVQRSGLYLGAVQLKNGSILPLAPLTLPYSPEFEPRADPKEGRNTLVDIARVTGGVERTTWDDVFSPTGLRSRQVRDLVIPLALTLLLLHVFEIAGRRLLLFAAARAWATSWGVPRMRRAARPVPTSTAPPGEDAAPSRPPFSSPATGTADAAAAKPVTSALTRAKAKARGRMVR